MSIPRYKQLMLELKAYQDERCWPGAIVHFANVLHDKGWIETVRVESYPYFESNIGLFMRVTHLTRTVPHWMGDISLRDHGIVPNSYNDHQAFLSRKEAEVYITQKTGKIYA